jgi:hypothetical protein
LVMDMLRLARQILDPPLRDLPDLHLLDARPGQERIYFGVGARLAHFQEQARLLPIADDARNFLAAPGGDGDGHALFQGVGDLRSLGKPLLRDHVRSALAVLIDQHALYLPQ